MAKTTYLQKVCLLAYKAVLDDLKLEHPIPAPTKMRKFVNQGDPSTEALEAARQSMEKDPDFRTRVAFSADIESVGEAGLLWLSRPDGWYDDLREIIDGAEEEESTSEMHTMSEVKAGGKDEREVNTSQKIAEKPPKPPEDFGLGGDEEMPNSQDLEETNTTKTTGRDSIKNELSGLVGLVDRLAEERQLVSAAAQDVDLSIYEARLKDLQGDLEKYKNHIDELSNNLELAEVDRKESKRLHSDALRNQVQLEKQLAEFRDINVKLEDKLAKIEVTHKEYKDGFEKSEETRIEAEALKIEAEKLLDTMTVERNTAREEHAAMMIERDEVSARLAEIDRQAGGVDVGTLQRDNRELAERAVNSEAELSQIQARLSTIEQELNSKTELSDQLQAEKADLSIRLSESETAHEEAVSRMESYKIDVDRVVEDLDGARVQRDELTVQVDELQESLRQALDDLARVRNESDEERSSYRQVRSERDSLLARMSEIEQKQDDHSQGLISATSERDALLSERDELLNERGKLKGEAAASQRESDQLTSRLKLLQEKLEPLEAEILNERRRGEELAANLIEANRERAKKDSDIKKLQEDQAQDDANMASFDEVSHLQEKLAKVENDYAEHTSKLEQELEQLKNKLADSNAPDQVVDTSVNDVPLLIEEPAIEEPAIEEPYESPVSPNNNFLGDHSSEIDMTELSFNGADTEDSEIVHDGLPEIPENFDEQFSGQSLTTGSSVWDQDWPPKDSEEFGDLDDKSGAVYLADFPAEETANGEVDIDEISELLSRTVTDFQAINTGDPDIPPSVFDSQTGEWNEADGPSNNSGFTGDRKRIELPTGLANNTVEVVEHVVATEDVVLLIDGDAVASLGWSKLPVFEQRNSLVSFLADISDRFGAAPQVVFDGQLAGQNSLPSSRLVRIRLSNSGISTTSVIDELLDTFPEQWPIAVVTDDARLISTAETKGATVIRNEQLLDFINLLAT